MWSLRTTPAAAANGRGRSFTTSPVLDRRKLWIFAAFTLANEKGEFLTYSWENGRIGVEKFAVDADRDVARVDNDSGIVHLQNLRCGKFALLFGHVFVATGLPAVIFETLVARPQAVLAHIARALVRPAPEDDAARRVVEADEDVRELPYPPMALPLGRVVEPGVDRTELAGTFRAGRHAAELQRLRDLRLSGSQ